MQILENISLAQFTTLGIGGPARYFLAVDTPALIADALRWCGERGLAWRVLGGGSNLLVSDRGFDGLIMHIRLRGLAPKAAADGPQVGSVEVEAGAGEDWDGFTAWAVANDLAGVECLSGIPGTVGAAPVQNIGAYGQEVDETVAGVSAWDSERSRMVELTPAECCFGYRSSIFNGVARGRYVITAVRFRLQPHAPATLRYAELQLRFRGAAAAPLAEVREAVRAIRRGKAMLLDPAEAESRSAGSFFKNPILTEVEFERLAPHDPRPPRFAVLDDRRRPVPGRVKVPAAWLIEQAGFSRGFHLPGSRAALSSRHALAIVNRGGATAAEVLELAGHVRAGVEKRFQIRLHLEPEMVGFEADML